MKKVLLFIVCSNIFLLACQNTSQGGGSSDSAKTGSSNSDSGGSASQTTSNVADTLKRCYLYTKNKDTVQLHVTQIGSVITGDMSFHLFGKDRNTGVINGTTVGDTLVLDYAFQSEGVMSIREEILIHQSDGYAVATGERKMLGDRQTFGDRKKIKAGPIFLSRVSCDQ